jgi:hypothetical protein
MIFGRVTSLLRNLMKDRFMHIKPLSIDLGKATFNLPALSAALH